MNNEYMYAIERSPEYLAHYGVLGMKWGVRNALRTGNSKKLGRQYAKAQKKLAKLEKRAANSKKYARRAALLGAGAAAAGGLAAAGTTGVSKGIAKLGGHAMNASRGVGTAMANLGRAAGNAALRIPGRGNKFKNLAINASKGMRDAGVAMQKAGQRGSEMHKGIANVSGAINRWGSSNSIAKSVADRAAGVYGKAAGKYASYATKGNAYAQKMASDVARGKAKSAIGGISNNTIARVGAGVIGAGLAAGAAKNAYRAATAKRKAEKFRSAMNESFKGTQYDKSGNRQGKKRRRR